METKPVSLPVSELDARRETAAILFPHGLMSNSPSQPLADSTKGKFGPYAGQLLVGEMNKGRIMRVILDKVGDKLQGACLPFFDGNGLSTGNNRLAFSQDGKTLYVTETNNGSRHGPNPPYEPKPGRMTLNAFPIKSNGRLDTGKKKVLANFGKETGTDGMTIDVQGNIYAAVRMASKHGIIVYSPQGKELAYIPTETLPTNCSFGNGKESAMLYVTAGTGLYRIQLKIDGYHPAVAN